MFGLKIFHGAAAEEAKAAPNPAGFLANFDRQMDYRGYGEALLSTLRHYPLSGAEPSYANAGTAPRPVMVIWGEADKTVPFNNSRKLMELMPSAKLYSFAKAGHDIAFSQSAMVADLILQFLASQSVPEPGSEPPTMRVEPRSVGANQ
jgi:pimeloyl-ACP methyl ester carboxylesterase